MHPNDIAHILTWWFWIFIVGSIFLPVAFFFFRSFADKGYIFAKTLGIIFLSYGLFFTGTLHILPFSRTSTLFLLLLPAVGYLLFIIRKRYPLQNVKKAIKPFLFIFLLEEMLFLSGIFFLSYVRTFSPDIHGLEKYMDFGFMNSIERSTYFPPKDMWLTPLSINYYYFGHLVTAVLTTLSGISSNITYNLMLATIFALCLVSSFSLGANLFANFLSAKMFFTKPTLIAGILAALIVTIGGNLHTIYTFFTPYENEKPVPPWELSYAPQAFPNAYWYPNATRYIYNTIHEFPIYSWTVADLHGHVLDIPFVLLVVAVLFSLFQLSSKTKRENQEITLFTYRISLHYIFYILLGFLLAVLYMTNAWDGIIYFLLTILVLLYVGRNKLVFAKPEASIKYLVLSIKGNKEYILHTVYSILLIGIAFFIFSQPFMRYFEPFVSGIGVLCSPDFLTTIGKFGPLLFEADHCQHSPWWQLLILYGFFFFFIFSFVALLLKYKSIKKSDFFVLILIILSVFLLLVPEFIYAKDIYPAHYRANTMFKLAFQAFMLLGLCCGYIIVRIITNIKQHYHSFLPARKLLSLCYLVLTGILLSLIFIYPYMALNSYYGIWQATSDGTPKKLLGLDGTLYLKNLHQSDYDVILWINKNIKGQPVILEAQGDSYTDYARVSSNTGLPTVLGWTVHEWLWRGTYDVPAPRITDVTTLYETQDLTIARNLLTKYNVEYVFVGNLEREKYLNLYEDKFNILGRVVYESGKTKLYKIN